MKKFLRGSSSRSSKEKQKEEEEKPKFNLPRTAEVRPCEWPSDDFLRRAGIYEDFYLLIENACLTDFLHDQRHQYLLLTNTFVQNFYFFPKKSPPTVEFHLYDVVKEMPLAEFCEVCKIPFEGTLDEPHRNEVEAFINTITVGETRKVLMQGLLAYIFLFYATLPYLLVVAWLVVETVETLVFLILSFCSTVYSAITLLVWAVLLLNG